MAIDMASVYAARYRKQPDMLRAAVMGQSPDPKLDSYTALNALRLVKEADMMDMAGKAQQPTSAPSILAQNLAPPAPPQGLAGMMPMGAPAGQMPQRAPQAPPMQAASGGLAGMYTPEEDYAAGGIVAFSRGGEAEDDYQRETSDTGYSDSQGRSVDAEGNLLVDDTDTEGGASRPVQRRAFARQDEYLQFDPSEMSAADQEAFLDRYMARMNKDAGPNIYTPAREDLTARKAAMAGDRRTGEGLAYLTAAGAVLKGRNLAEGASNALPAYAQQLGEVRRAEQQEKRAIEQMNFALNDAERKERMGNQRGAQSALESARKFQQDANKAKSDKLRYSADIATRNVQYDRLANKGAGANAPKLAEQLGAAEIEYGRNPTKENKTTVEALRRAVSQTKTSFSTGEMGGLRADMAALPVQASIDTKVNDALQKFKSTDSAGSAYRAALRKKDAEGAERLLQAEEDRLRGVFRRSEAGSRAPAAPAAAPKPSAAPATATKVVSMADVNATVAASGKTKQEVIDALNAKGYTVK
jgi:hypothetical protein